ncbi:thiol-dependent ubiquitin-specific protease activity protein [Paramecium bursaria]
MSYLRKFNQYLSQFELQLHDVEADGNCLFRAIADQLTGDEGDYQIFRNLACKQLRLDSQYYKDFVPEHDMKQYIQIMQQDGEWGGHLELQALSDSLQILIIVHTLENHHQINPRLRKRSCWDCIFGRENKYYGKQIHIAFHRIKKMNHYTSIRSKLQEDMSTAETEISTFK